MKNCKKAEKCDLLRYFFLCVGIEIYGLPINFVLHLIRYSSIPCYVARHCSRCSHFTMAASVFQQSLIRAEMNATQIWLMCLFLHWTSCLGQSLASLQQFSSTASSNVAYKSNCYTDQSYRLIFVFSSAGRAFYISWSNCCLCVCLSGYVSVC